MSEQIARVLIVEDAANWRDTLEAILKRIGCRVYTASTVRQGMDALCSGPFDVAIVDVRLMEGDSNNVSGFEIVREAWARCMVARFIVISGYSAEEEQVRSALGDEIPYRIFNKAEIPNQQFRDTVTSLIAEAHSDAS